MKYGIKYLPVFTVDRDVIRAHLSKFYTGTEKRFFILLRKKIKRLRSFPHICPVYEFDPFYRKLVVGQYVVLYTTDESRAIIEIHRMLPGSWDILSHL
jgi:plasmid stabilization system protein ParE